MAKEKVVFVCKSCGHESAKWEGKCASCGEWNTYSEEKKVKLSPKAEAKTNWAADRTTKKVLPIQEVVNEQNKRISTPDPELNRVLGGGIVVGSLILIGGEPGIGKSTLTLQTALSINASIAYISGEESPSQIKMRGDRIGISNQACYIIAETEIEKALSKARSVDPQLIIIDSIQTMFSHLIDSSAGTVSQIRECTAIVQQFAKQLGIPIILIGHITKEGSIAGPKLLEHIVDVVLQFEGDQHYSYRMLRAIKNRFGSTDELGIYRMIATGLEPVANPSEMLMYQSDRSLSGSVIGATIEGVRPFLIEVQALVSTAVYGTPQRSATGFDLRRLSMLLAVLEKRCGIPFSNQDVFLNIAGGIKVSDPGIDLAIIVALVSSHQNIPVSHDFAFAGEVGLTGEIRAVNRIENRIQESNRLGFKHIFVSKNTSFQNVNHALDIQIKYLSKVDDLLRDIFA